jgi:exopolysaccharide biosynthesis polyprenyl glycosylphosphotransferase
LNLFKTVDLVLLVISFAAAAAPRLKAMGATSVTEFLSMRFSIRNFVLFSVLLLLWHSLFSLFGLYRSKRLSGHRTEATDVLKATSLGTLALLLVGTTFHLSITDPLFVASFWLLGTSTSILSRKLIRVLLTRIRQRGHNLRNVLIVGTNARSLKLAGDLEDHSGLGYRILGFVDQPWSGTDDFNTTGYSRVCDFGGLSAFLREHVVDEVMITLPLSSFYSQTSHICALCCEHGIITHFLPNLFDSRLTPANSAGMVVDSLITFQVGPMQGWALLLKRFLDILISLTCIILFAPIFIVAAVLIKLTSPGPILFSQTRVGLNKRLISVYKLRTMVPDAEKQQAELEHLNEVKGPVFKIKNDPRITTIGRFLRKTSIDELPQLFSVLKGDMSLVGPRPLPLRDFKGFDSDWQRRRFSIRPGITCLWQIKGRSSIQFDRWMELDLEYIDRWSVWLDLEILVRTIPAVLKGAGAA